MDLYERFKSELFPGYGGDQEAAKLFSEIKGSYSGPCRHYHNLGHIQNCLNVFDFVAHGAVEKKAIVAAIYYHDIVYDSTAKDNEARSAEFAQERLDETGFGNPFSAKVRNLILATKHLGGLDSYDEQVMADVDLSELAVDYKTFVSNTHKIRKESSWVDAADFRKGRVDFFRKMLERPSIYYTEPFQFLFEARARENLQHSVDELTER